MPADRSVSVVDYEIGVIRRAAHGLCSCPARAELFPDDIVDSPSGAFLCFLLFVLQAD
jgi:hypothetical protein